MFGADFSRFSRFSRLRPHPAGTICLGMFGPASRDRGGMVAQAATAPVKSSMPPVMACSLASLRWLTGDDREAVIALVVLLQNLSLILTGDIALALACKVTGSVWLALLLFVGGLVFYFRLSFQHTHDRWLVLLTL